MKAVKVRIRRGSVNEPMMVYPARYNAIEVDRNGIGPTNVNPASVVYSGGIGRGEAEEWCYIILPDALADEYALDPDMSIEADSKADADMEAWRIANGAPMTTVRDPDRIHAIRAKQEAGMALTQEDLDALDETKDTSGINRTRRSISRFTQRSR